MNDRTQSPFQTRKVHLCAQEVEYLGMIVQPNQLAMDPVKLDGIAKWPTPMKVKDIWSFLGFANFYHHFIPNYSNIACSLINLTKKNLPWTWTSVQEAAFSSLKTLFLSRPILHLPNPTAPFALATNISKHALGAILLQTDENGDWHPCSYLSQSFSLAEWNYDIYDRELLAVIRALKTWRHYLHGSPFPVQVFTDHKNLTFFHSPQSLNRRQAHWLLDLVDFDLKLIYVPSRQLTALDALSCRPDHLPPSSIDNEGVTLLPASLFVHVIDTALLCKISSSSFTDPLVLQALQSIDGSIPPAFRSHLSDWQHINGLLTYKNCVYVPPTDSLRYEILHRCHNHPTTGHPGLLKTCQLVSADFWWLGLTSFIHNYVAGCATCQQNKTNTHPTIPPLTPIPSSSLLPFRQISCDLITNLPPFNGFDSLLVVVNHGLCKGVILCPTKKTVTAEGIMSLFFHKVFLHFDLYTKIISNCGPQFASKFTKKLGWILQYDISLSTAYHPQTDSKTEQVNQEIETYLWIFCRDHPSIWTDSIPHAKFAHNHRPHSVTGKSPFYLMMEYEPLALPSVLPHSSISTVELGLKTLLAAWEEALAAYEQTNSTNHGSKISKTFHSIQERRQSVDRSS